MLIPTLSRIKELLTNAVLPASLLGGGYLVYSLVAAVVGQFTAPSAPAVVATQAPQVAKVATEVITPAKLVVYKAPAKAKLGLPRAVQDNASQHVLVASRVVSSPRPTTVTTLVDDTTGEATAYVKQEAYPWLSKPNSGSASLAYGVRSGAMVARLSLYQSLFQIKAVSFGGVANLDSDGQYFAGVGASYRW